MFRVLAILPRKLLTEYTAKQYGLTSIYKALNYANGNPKSYDNKKTWYNHRKKMMSANAAVLFPHIDDSGKGKETVTKHSITIDDF
jgi:hypothetical protein